jgi:alkylation response protein AidB-like acyl-CoA dehydrogenase
MATEYSKARVQFDKPIATHQVIQHKIVDMLHKLELGRVGVHFAAWSSDVDDEHRERAAAIAKSSMAEAAVFVTAENIQVHGAVGFTWDSDAQFFYKRAKQNDTLLGYQGWQRQRIADFVLDA